MASSSSSSKRANISESYDVFLSFRGEDTRSGFISHLYKALTKEHINTFIDRSLKMGNFIAPELLVAIEASRFAVVVLSKDFAASKWCLEEIAKIVDCMERKKMTVIPVFYHVEPSDVRHQRGSFKQGFADHEANHEILPETVKTWKAAFEKVGLLIGSHITPQIDESEIITKVVKEIQKGMQVTVPPPVTDGLVGIDSRVVEVKSILNMKPNEVRFLGITGMSGMGKTTLAEEVYKDIQKNFQGSCYIANIKDISKQNDSTNLYMLQKKLLDDILEDNIQVQSVIHGQTLLRERLHRLKVIIILDDVNHEDQLTYLAGRRGWFGPGSRIIVTTTNNYLLAPDIVDEIYTCEEMKSDDALRLFCQSAFKKEHPTHGYEKLSDDLVKLAGGLPLALKVYGRLLYGQEENYWKGILKKLRKYPHEEVLGRLETVYARLDRDQKNTFVYIACFLRGRNIQLVENILTNIGLQPESEISDLKKKFLISINHDDSVWVHDLLQQMCWEVLRKESEKHDGKHTAIKYRQDLEDILSTEPKGTRMIEIINQEPYKVEGADFYDDHKCFSKMMKLKFLRISKIDFQQGLDRLSSDLRILEWYGCSLKSFPKMFNPKHIFELEMCYSQLETLWEKVLDLPNLRSINLSFSKDLAKIPDLTATPHLEKLNLEGCTNLTELHESILFHKELRYMNLKGCFRVRSLGRTMEMDALEALYLSGCLSLEYLPRFGETMRRLQHLYVDGTSITKLPENLGEMCDLRNINASETSIEELPSSIYQMKKLRLLHVHGCNLLFKAGGFRYTNLTTLSPGLRELNLSYCNLSMVPDGIGLLYCLIRLDLSGNDFVSLPADISLLSKLRMLLLNNCMMLQSLPKLSLVDEDTDYGPRGRFNYYVSVEGVDVSKFHASGNGASPTVSCLNCPKLAENESGCNLAEKILNSYLQLRSRYWITPEAVFEIVGAGREIPSKFRLLRSNESMILEGPWIGVSICVVIGVDQIDSYMEAKYMLTVHIHVDKKHWQIPVSINYLVEGLDNQVVLYWTVAGDLQKVLDWKKKECRFSFDVQPADGNIQVTKFGVHFVRDKDILQLKQLEDSTSQLVKNLFLATLILPKDMRWYTRACEAEMDLHTSHSYIHDLPSSIIKFILDFGIEQDSLVGIHKIMKCHSELNQQVFNKCQEEWSRTVLFPLVCDYYRISHGISELYTDFVRLLKDISDSWFSVKLALEQILAKVRAGVFTYREMLEQLNDLEATESVRFSDNFLIFLAYISKQTVAFLKNVNKQLKRTDISFKSLKVMAKVSSITIAAFLTMVATYMGDYELLKEMKEITSYTMWLHVIQRFSTRMSNKEFIRKSKHTEASFKRELLILDFHSNLYFLQDFKNRMARYKCFSNEIEDEMLIIVDKLEKKIVSFSVTIDDMCRDAQRYSLDTREAEIGLNLFIAESSLKITKCGVDLLLDQDIKLQKLAEDSMKDAMNILYQSTLSLPDNNDAKPQNSLVGICKIFKCIHKVHRQTLKSGAKPQNSLVGICKVFKCIHKVHRQTLKSGEWTEEWSSLITATFTIYKDFTGLLKQVYNSWLSLKLELEEILVKVRSNNYPYKEMEQQLRDITVHKYVSHTREYDKFDKSIALFCVEARSFLYFTQEVKSKMKLAAKAGRVLCAGVACVLLTYLNESYLMEDMLSDIPTYGVLRSLFHRILKKNGYLFDEDGKFRNWRICREKFQIWEFDAYKIVRDLMFKINLLIISLLSKLRMLLLNNCMMLQSLPKLSLVDEDTDYGPRGRFNYYVSVEGVDVSKFHASGNGASPTVSCLNCPKLAENESGCNLAEKILNSYLQLRSRYWITPEAVFEIVGAGREIPSKFRLLRSNESMILEGPWIGVSICVVIGVDQIDSYMEAKYMLTVHIHVDKKHWQIPVSINYLVEGLDNQVVLYWTVAGDLQKVLDWKKKECRFSFDVQPADGNIQVTKFGVHFVRDKDILQLKQLEDSTSQLVKNLFLATLILPKDMRWYTRACEAEMDLHTSHSYIHDLPSSIIKFILDFGIEQDSLVGIHKIMKCHSELNQQVFNKCQEEWSRTVLFPLVCDYYRISHGISELYTDFVRLLKDISDSWFSVKLALEQILAKVRAGVFTYREMLEQLNDLEATESVRFSDNFLIFLAYISKQTVAFLKNVNKQLKRTDISFKSLKVMAKVSSITIAAFLTMVATYMGDYELLKEMKEITSYTMWLHVIQRFSTRMSNKEFIRKSKHTEASFKRELLILDFHSNLYFLQDFKNRMARYKCFSNEIEDEMLIIVDKLEKKIVSFSVTIDDMCRDAQRYSLDTREAEIGLNLFIAESSLKITKCGVDLLLDQDIKLQKLAEDSMKDAMNILYQSTLSLPDNNDAKPQNSLVGICKIFKCIHKVHRQTLKSGAKPQNSLVGICKVFKCIHKVHRQTLKSGEWTEEWSSLITATFTIYKDFTGLLKQVYNSWLSLKLELEEILVKVRSNNYPYKEMEQQLRDITVHKYVSHTREYDKFDKSIALFCVEARSFLYFTQEVKSKMKLAAKAGRVLCAGVACVLLTYLNESYLMEDMLSDIPTYGVLRSLFHRILKKNGYLFDEDGKFRNWRICREKFQIWEFDAYKIVRDLMFKINFSNCSAKEIENEMVITIEELEMMINNNISTIITDMCRDACKYYQEVEVQS